MRHTQAVRKNNYAIPPMTRPKPFCPCCASNTRVCTLGGGSYPKYRYRCGQCKNEWQCVPPHRVTKPAVKSQPTVYGTVYRCSICLQPKRGHSCTGFAEIAARSESLRVELPLVAGHGDDGSPKRT